MTQSIPEPKDGGFPPPVNSGEDGINVPWKLIPPADLSAILGAPFNDNEFRSREANFGDRKWAWSYVPTNPSYQVDNLVITNLVLYLRYDTTGSALFLNMNLRWWATHRSQLPLPQITVKLYKGDSLLTNVDMIRPPMEPGSKGVIDCQGVWKDRPCDWTVPPVKISGAKDAWFQSATRAELVMPAVVPPSHGGVCPGLFMKVESRDTR